MNFLEKYYISNMPPSAYYVPNFISTNEEEILLKYIYKQSSLKWTQLLNRRLQNWGGVPHLKGMIPAPIPEWLESIISKVDEFKIFLNKRPNHVLINEYLPGQGILPHKDGPIFHPIISTLSLGSHIVLDYYQTIAKTEMFHKKEQIYFSSLLLEPRSLLLMKDDLYQDYLHGIVERKEDILDDKILNMQLCSYLNDKILKRRTRVSLTMRHVPNTIKAKLKL